MKFRKKSRMIVEATQWFNNGDHPEDDCFRPFEDTGEIPTEKREGNVVRYYRTSELNGKDRCKKCFFSMHIHGWIDTLEGGHIVCPSDWIITEEEGKFYPCEADIFEKTYDKY